MKSSIRLVVAFALMFSWMESMSAEEIEVWIGTSGPHGIYRLVLDTNNAKLSKPKQVAELGGAGFLVLHGNKEILYSTERRGRNEGFVTAFSIQRDNENVSLKPLGQQAIGDSGAAHLNLDRESRVLMSAQYGGSSIATFPILEDGKIGDRTQLIKHQGGSGVVGTRQDAPHPHWVGTSPGNKWVCVPDLGSDQVVVYQLDADRSTIKQQHAVSLAPGSGPRHMKFHSNGKFAYVLNELAMTITVFAFDESSGRFDELQVIESLPEELKDDRLNSAAEIRIHPNGKFVYASNRGHDSISVYAIDLESGQLTFVEREAIRGSWPRNFNIDPSGKWLIAAGRYSNTLSLFEVDETTGRLAFTRTVVNVPEPICVLFGSTIN